MRLLSKGILVPPYNRGYLPPPITLFKQPRLKDTVCETPVPPVTFLRCHSKACLYIHMSSIIGLVHTYTCARPADPASPPTLTRLWGSKEWLKSEWDKVSAVESDSGKPACLLGEPSPPLWPNTRSTSHAPTWRWKDLEKVGGKKGMPGPKVQLVCRAG